MNVISKVFLILSTYLPSVYLMAGNWDHEPNPMVKQYLQQAETKFVLGEPPEGLTLEEYCDFREQQKQSRKKTVSFALLTACRDLFDPAQQQKAEAEVKRAKSLKMCIKTLVESYRADPRRQFEIDGEMICAQQIVARYKNAGRYYSSEYEKINDPAIIDQVSSAYRNQSYAKTLRDQVPGFRDLSLFGRLSDFFN